MSQLREILSVWRGADDGAIDWISAADDLEELLDQGAGEDFMLEQLRRTVRRLESEKGTWQQLSCSEQRSVARNLCATAYSAWMGCLRYAGRWHELVPAAETLAKYVDDQFGRDYGEPDPSAPVDDYTFDALDTPVDRAPTVGWTGSSN